jgi:sec-independent protein translocase protein TatC
MNHSEEGSLRDHLADLRFAVVRILWIIGIGFGLSIYFSEDLFDIVRAPIAPYLTNNGLVFTAPIDKFMAHIKVSLLSGAILTCPFWLYQVWNFIAPGLYKHEKKLGIIFISVGSLLFTSGVLFVYKLVFPMAFKYLLTFGGTTDIPMITINEYLSFFVVTTVVFGAAFEMPLIIVMLGMLGLVNAQFLREKRRFAIMIIAVLCAVVTPPDALSMLSLLAPLVALYEISIICVALLGRKAKS